jgi:hypothetical protein
MTISTSVRWSTGCGNWRSSTPASASLLADRRHSDVKELELFYEGGLEAFVRYLDRSKKPLVE